MAIAYNFFQFIFRRFIGIVFLLMVCNASWAVELEPKPGKDGQENWVDSNLVRWAKMTKKNSMSYGEALVFCAEKEKINGISIWQLPTQKQAERFYAQAVATQDKKDIQDWVLGVIWLSTSDVKNKFQIANLGEGQLSWGGDVPESKRDVACVSTYGFDKKGNFSTGELTWSKMTNKRYTWEQAKEACANLDQGDSGKEWKLPTSAQINDGFVRPFIIINNGLIYQEMIKRGWVPGWVWGSDKSSQYRLSLTYPESNDDEAAMICVRQN